MASSPFFTDSSYHPLGRIELRSKEPGPSRPMVRWSPRLALLLAPLWPSGSAFSEELCPSHPKHWFCGECGGSGGSLCCKAWSLSQRLHDLELWKMLKHGGKLGNNETSGGTWFVFLEFVRYLWIYMGLTWYLYMYVFCVWSMGGMFHMPSWKPMGFAGYMRLAMGGWFQQCQNSEFASPWSNISRSPMVPVGVKAWHRTTMNYSYLIPTGSLRIDSWFQDGLKLQRAWVVVPNHIWYYVVGKFHPPNSHEFKKNPTWTMIVDPTWLQGHFSTHGAASFVFACHPVLLWSGSEWVRDRRPWTWPEICWAFQSPWTLPLGLKIKKHMSPQNC